MKTIDFIKRKIDLEGHFGFNVPLSDFATHDQGKQKVDKFGSSYSLGGLLERAKSRALAQNPIVPNAADIVNWLIWDTYKVAANTSLGANFKFFTQPIGSNNKTKMDTNLEQVQRLPDPQWMNVISLGFMFGPEVTLADIATLCNNYYTEFWVGGKVYVEGRYECFPPGSGITGSASNTTATTLTSLTTNGVANYSNLFDLRLPGGIDLGVQTDPSSGQVGRVVSDGLIGVTILQGQQFKVENNAPGGAQSTSASPGVGMRLVCILNGVLSRGVQ